MLKFNLKKSFTLQLIIGNTNISESSTIYLNGKYIINHTVNLQQKDHIYN